jgi:apolipoprotein N-acyltransferase
MTAMRAVETKVPVVRVANTGISAVIEPSGRIAARTPLFKRGTEIERVYWQPRRTIYTAVGDLFAEICFALAVIGLIWSYFRPRRLRQNDPEEVEDESTERYFSNGHGS